MKRQDCKYMVVVSASLQVSAGNIRPIDPVQTNRNSLVTWDRNVKVIKMWTVVMYALVY